MFIDKLSDLGEPDCECGYSFSKLERALDYQQWQRLMLWMRGQTMALCDGRRYDHEKQEYFPACGGVAHGPVIYGHDLERWFAGLPVID